MKSVLPQRQRKQKRPITPREKRREIGFWRFFQREKIDRTFFSREKWHFSK